MPLTLPARHEETLPHALGPDEVRARTQRRAASLGWRILAESDGRIAFRVGTSWMSWGELVTVTFQPASISITSQCRLGTQVVDWGKNRSNCERLALGLLAGLAGASR
jgi:hypothetical protein